MGKLILALVVGGIATWLYRSQQARDKVSAQLAGAPAPVRQGAESLAAAAASAAERAGGMIDSTSLPQQVKDSAFRVTSAIQSATKDPQGKQPEGGATARTNTDAAVAKSVDHLIPDEVLAEEDATARASAEARRQQQTGT